MVEGGVTILLDADSCPVEVRRLLAKTSKRHGVDVVFLANRRIDVPPQIELVTVRHGTVDDEILHRLARRGGPAADAHPEGDQGAVLVVTRDIPLAEAVLEWGAHAMNDRGTLFDPATIAERRSIRDAGEAIRASGLETMSRARRFGTRELKAFADALDRFLARL
ncbi:MAG: DUF188 domain-containing protein [Spirochaetales bacterium]|nr:DUF188 domain-containing protein [Spirochaetales bacterium]